MARQPRIDIAGYPQHLIQRGNNRQACFFSDEDRRCYLNWVQSSAKKYGACVHAYVLMSNHVHLLATGRHRGALGSMMQSLGRRYVRYVNSKYNRTGTLWEGRFKSSLIESDRYLLACYRYIELNPVRAGIVRFPNQYRWSSYHFNANGCNCELVTPHETYLSLGESRAARQAAYRQLFLESVDNDEIAAIRNHVNRGRVLGSASFKEQVETETGCCARVRAPGRPQKKYSDPV